MPPALRLRVPTPGLLALPWGRPLGEWDPTSVALRDVPVGPSRHLVRFVEADGRLWALKELPARLATREYDVLRELERRRLAAVRVAGVVDGVGAGEEPPSVLVTRYLEGSWQYRRLLMRVPWSAREHRSRLFDAMALLLVDLHRNGTYWGDCSLANTLFMRDGQSIQAWLVDAETAELHPSLSDGQRRDDLERTVENVAGGLLDVAARREEPPEVMREVLDEASVVAERYEQLWELLFDAPVVDLDDHDRIAARLHRLEELGFELDEVRFEPEGAPSDHLRMRVGVGGRTWHAARLRDLTGLQVGEGQAAILLNDVRAHHAALRRRAGADVDEEDAARAWRTEVYEPGSRRALAALGGSGGAAQAYCDLLEVRWLMSEAAGHDVGDAAALRILGDRVPPVGAAARMAVVDQPTQELPLVRGASGGVDGAGAAQQRERDPADRHHEPVRDDPEDE